MIDLQSCHLPSLDLITAYVVLCIYIGITSQGEHINSALITSQYSPIMKLSTPHAQESDHAGDYACLKG